jgi:hypothetical protein
MDGIAHLTFKGRTHAFYVLLEKLAPYRNSVVARMRSSSDSGKAGGDYEVEVFGTPEAVALVAKEIMAYSKHARLTYKEDRGISQVKVVGKSATDSLAEIRQSIGRYRDGIVVVINASTRKTAGSGPAQTDFDLDMCGSPTRLLQVRKLISASAAEGELTFEEHDGDPELVLKRVSEDLARRKASFDDTIGFLQ